MKSGARLTIAILIALAFLMCALGGMRSSTIHPPGAPVRAATSASLPDVSPTHPAQRAVIVDQLGLTYPNPTFTQAATNILTRAGYAAAYIPGNQVTVQLYRELPARDYGLIILRVHSGLTVWTNTRTGQIVSGTLDAVLFTGEPFTKTKYRREWQDEQLGPAYYYEGASPLFGVTSGFIRRSMQGRFDRSIIVLMGCHGLRSASVAQALLERGAGAVVGWNKDVSANHTDAATKFFLDRLLNGGATVAQAVAETNAHIGPDPVYQSNLVFLSR